MTTHAENALRCSGIPQILDLPLAIPTPEARGTECLLASKDSQVLDLVTTSTAAVCAVVTDEGAIAQE
jgi:hypothetical protein